MLMAQGRKQEASKLVIKAHDAVDDIIDGVMKELDRPENGAWKRAVLGRIKGVTTWNQQINDLVNELGVHTRVDPDIQKKIEAITKQQ